MTVTADQTGLSKPKLKKYKIMDTEIWVEIKGYEGCYEASSLGRIRSIDRRVNIRLGKQRTCKGCVINGSLNNSGYMCVGLWKNQKMSRFYIHRIIATCFILNPNGNPCVNHKNGNRLDNRIENLEWVTYSENTIHCLSVLNPNGTKRQKLYDVNGVKKTIPVWCKIYSKSYSLVTTRLYKGWDIEDALTQPLFTKIKSKKVINN